MKINQRIALFIIVLLLVIPFAVTADKKSSDDETRTTSEELTQPFCSYVCDIQKQIANGGYIRLSPDFPEWVEGCKKIYGPCLMNNCYLPIVSNSDTLRTK